MDAYRSVGGAVLLARDGTAYCSSPAIPGEHGSTRRHATSKVTYCHAARPPVLVKPGCDKVIPLAPEFIRPQDGAQQQDGEINAAQRWLAAHGGECGRLKATILGADRYCHAPFCRALPSLGLDFILVCKPDAPPVTYEWVEYRQRTGAVGTVTRTRWTGKRRETDTYRYTEAVPLRDADDALTVNGCEITTTDTDGEVWYCSAFATPLALNGGNVAEVVTAGRGRWKIENENNNTLKTKGYHFEHHYGHGQRHLSSWLASRMILALLTHTVLEWLDDQYQMLRRKLPSRQRLFNDIRTLTSYRCFDRWEALMDFMLKSFDPLPPAEPNTGWLPK